MSLVTERYPGAIYQVTRRCDHGFYRLRPDEELVGAFGVVLADAAERTGVRIIAAVVMSNHWHAVVWDPEGRVSEFCRDVHGTMGRYCNWVARDAWHGRVWDAAQVDTLRLGSAQAVADAVGYVLANPVSAGMVAGLAGWKGLQTRAEEIGTGRGTEYVRPAAFFRGDGPVSARARLVTYAPPGVEVEEFRRMAVQAVEKAVKKAREERKGKGYLGMARVLERDWYERPPKEPLERGVRRERRKRVAASSPEAMALMVARMLAFRRAHEQARKRFVGGERETTFPAGTYRAHRVFGAARGEDDGPMREYLAAC